MTNLHPNNGLATRLQHINRLRATAWEDRLNLLKTKMKYQDLLAIAGCIANAGAVSVSGAAEGFAKGVTGGGSATAVYPSTTAELVSYLGDSEARAIVLTKTYAFIEIALL